ncbi:competence protein CoiA [Gottfriedia luciferensis]|uniref:competence protein CoiA n=1 Tax=Gottfriedia luciferensis TaxID=178774 RepID=UPI001302D7B4|nr:competence protein CoiA family protein [Gottfriedia luciferensis]
MIIAENRKQQIINLFEIKSTEELLKLKQNGSFICPVCKKAVRLRFGKIRRAHFAHVELTECENDRKESAQHLEGKYDLYEFFNKPPLKVYVEKYMREINQRPDLLIELMDQKISIEYQCSNIPIEIIEQRTKSYEELDIKVIWIFGQNLLKQKYKYCFSVNSISKYCLLNSSVPSIIFYNPSTKTFSFLSSLIAFSVHSFVGKKTEIKLKNLNPSLLLFHSKLEKENFTSTWCDLKRMYRKKQHLFYKGSFYQLKEKMYHLQIDYLPGIVGIPLDSNSLIAEHCIVWQGIIYFQFIHNSSLGEIICLNDIKNYCNIQVEKGEWKFCDLATKDHFKLEKCVENYIDFLVKFRIVKRLKNGKISKIANAIIPKSFQQALDEDSLTANSAFDMLFNANTDSND